MDFNDGLSVKTFITKYNILKIHFSSESSVSFTFINLQYTIDIKPKTVHYDFYFYKTHLRLFKK